MPRRLVTSVAVAVIVLALTATPEVGANPDPRHPATQPASHAVAAPDWIRAIGAPAWPDPDGAAANIEVLGHHDLGGGGFNADIWVHRTTAYVGIWGRDPTEEIPCPATGVKVVDIQDPAAPTLVGVLQNPALTTGEDVVVRSVATPSFTGDLAVVGIQACGGYRPVFRGLQFFDVTDPSDPTELGRWSAIHPTIGCHEVDLAMTSTGRVLASCAVPFAEQYDAGEAVVIVDATDPSAPEKVGTYTDTLEGAAGCTSAALAHSVRFAGGGLRLYVSYWDSGTIELDVSDPSIPVVTARTVIAPPDEDGDNHSVTEAGGRWLVINPEDKSPALCGEAFGGWGEARLYERRGSQTRFLGTFATPNSQSSRTDGIFTVHNTEIWGSNQAFSSWYSDGIRWWEIGSNGRTKARGSFVPPATPDPNGYWPTVPLVWGVAVQPGRGLVVASDINGGLWVLRPIGI